jgi:hypothetical protein
MSTQEVVQRLKAAQEKEDQMERDEGKAAGRKWAERTATPKELRRVAEYIDRCEQDNTPWHDVDFPGWMAPFGATDYFVFAIRPQDKDDRDAPGQFWEEALGDDAHRIEDSDFLRGFGEGAVEVWNEVSAQL